LSKDTEIYVVRPDFEEDSILAVPLIKHGVDVIKVHASGGVLWPTR